MGRTLIHPHPMTRTATFDDDRARRYRYRLTRIWDPDKLPVAFLMLNPSAADAMVEDPTVYRCINYAMDWGFGGLVVVNAFALISTDPKALYSAGMDPVGPENDEHLLAVHRSAALTVCGWGNHGLHGDRQARILELLTPHRELHCLELTKSHQPRHPLYIPKDRKPVVFAAKL